MEAFAAEMLGSLARRNQRAKGELYVRGLTLDGKRKSMQPMAERLGVDHQQLQQFISSSTWDHVEVRRRVARWAAAHIAPEAYAIDDSGFPKDGYDSPGVARMYCGALGKRGNCRIGVSVNLVSDRASAAVDWRLFIPESWDDAENSGDTLLAEAIRRRRARAGIPDQVRHREKWRQALEMFDEVRDQWDLPDLPLVADAGYGYATGFRLGLTERGLAYAVAVKAVLVMMLWGLPLDDPKPATTGRLTGQDTDHRQARPGQPCPCRYRHPPWWERVCGGLRDVGRGG
ncbi:IS701 family transposase [Streptomyces sp. NPDC005181]|uniref:IS701 family transposase n=1 Tax=Streptomyces sp. NPDC005181 TaxID=3156869 RepID=UPI0033B595A3